MRLSIPKVARAQRDHLHGEAVDEPGGRGGQFFEVYGEKEGSLSEKKDTECVYWCEGERGVLEFDHRGVEKEQEELSVKAIGGDRYRGKSLAADTRKGRKELYMVIPLKVTMDKEACKRIDEVDGGFG